MPLSFIRPYNAQYYNNSKYRLNYFFNYFNIPVLIQLLCNIILWPNDKTSSNNIVGFHNNQPLSNQLQLLLISCFFCFQYLIRKANFITFSFHFIIFILKGHTIFNRLLSFLTLLIITLPRWLLGWRFLPDFLYGIFLQFTYANLVFDFAVFFFNLV